MKLVPVICEKCTAPLQIPEDVKFVTCRYCETRLKIDNRGDEFRARIIENLQRSAEAVDVHARKVTAAADRLQHESRRLSLRNDILRLKHELNQMDQQWEVERRTMFVWSRHGRRSPSVMEELGVMLVSLVVIIPLLVFTTNGLSEVNIATGVFCVVVGLFALRRIFRMRNAVQYHRALMQHFRRRSSLENKIANRGAQLAARTPQDNAVWL